MFFQPQIALIFTNYNISSAVIEGMN